MVPFGNTADIEPFCTVTSVPSAILITIKSFSSESINVNYREGEISYNMKFSMRLVK